MIPLARRIDRRGLIRVAAGAVLAAGLLEPACAAADPGAIATWGDSLTFGTGASRIAFRYPNMLGSGFAPPRAIFPGGVGGDSSMQIAARMLADTTHRDWIAVLWAGRNNYQSTDQVLADLAAMVAHHEGARFVVLSIPNANVPEEYRGGTSYAAIAALNRRIASTYPGHFLDIRRHLIDDGLRDSGLVPTPQDLTDLGHDVPPTSLRADHIHLNDAGQAEVARRVHDFIAAQGW